MNTTPQIFMPPAAQVPPAPSRRDLADVMEAARDAQEAWCRVTLPNRLKLVGIVRSLIAENAQHLAAVSAQPRGRRPEESLVAEVAPLADACAFLQRRAEKLLRPRKPGRRGQPLWLWNTRSQINREPHGVILVIGPGNYPLLLPGVQVMQALVAGNAVLLKPSPWGVAAAHALAGLLARAGLDPRLVQLLESDHRPVRQALEAGVDKVVLTGSVGTGRAVLRAAAETITPATMELAGCDACIIRADADLELAAAAIAFSLRFNASRTCIAARRVLVDAAIAPRFEQALLSRLRSEPPAALPDSEARSLGPVIRSAMQEGARILRGSFVSDSQLTGPLVMTGCPKTFTVGEVAPFSPVIFCWKTQADADAITLANRSPYALGASIFTRDPAAASRLAGQLTAGVVLINDLIVPTADPRLPFGGRRRSGFGVTRGEEGLLAMTVPKVIVRSQGRHRPYYAPLDSDKAGLLQHWLRATHDASPGRRILHFLKLAGAALRLRARRQPKKLLPS